MSSDETSVPVGYARDIFDLSGRAAVITGGGSGLGRAIAIGYAQCGVTVVVADINEDGAAETKATIDEQGGTAVTVPLDVTKRSQCVEVADAVRCEHGRVDILVNGIGPTLMESPMTREAAQTTSFTADFIKARVIRPRVGLPRELIGAAIFLASDASELVTGHTIMCDDGYMTA